MNKKVINDVQPASCKIIFFAILLYFGISGGAENLDVDDFECAWASRFQNLTLLATNATLQDQVMTMASRAEGRFVVYEIGIDNATGRTFDGMVANLDTGKLIEGHNGHYPINEAFHLSLLILALNGSRYATLLLQSSMDAMKGKIADTTVEEFAVYWLERKINTFTDFHLAYPAFGGFQTYGGSITGVTQTFTNQMAYDGTFVWAMVAVAQALDEMSAENDALIDLARRYQQHVNVMANSILTMLYNRMDEKGGLLNEIIIRNIRVPATESNYYYSPATCASSDWECFLNDVYDGEMMLIFAYLYGNWTGVDNATAKTDTWEMKRERLEKVDLQTADGPITVEKGWFFGVYERFKYLFLPYLDIPIQARLFRNNEKARTYYSVENDYPGLFGKVTDYVTTNDYINLWHTFGIPEVAFNRPFGNETVTPYGTFPQILVDDLRGNGLAWYIAMLRGARMQGPFGSTDATKITGDYIAPVLSWRVKLSPVLAFDGGVVPFVRRYLQKTEKYKEFCDAIESLWLSVFGNDTLAGENLPILLPSSVVPVNSHSFSGCEPIKQATTKKHHTVLIVSLSLLVFTILFAFVFFALWKWKLRKVLRAWLGLHEAINKDYYGNDDDSIRRKQKETDAWEIQPANLVIFDNKKLGSGAFAAVFKGILKGEAPIVAVMGSINLALELRDDANKDVAVKLLPQHADQSDRDDFLREIDFMKRLGFHEHILNMLGCITNAERPILVVELCTRGDLLKLLRETKTRVEKGESENCLKPKDLLSIAWQVADAMVYLSSRNFIHRDLAARNILVTGKMNAKIGDFGLCRLIDQALYTARGGLLPIKWMAIESLRHMEYTTKSDVWSYGVMLYEIFTWGDAPFVTVEASDMVQFLQDGNRLPQPQFATDKIYEMMMTTWQLFPEDRPKFEEIRGQLTKMLEQKNTFYGYLQFSQMGSKK